MDLVALGLFEVRHASGLDEGPGPLDRRDCGDAPGAASAGEVSRPPEECAAIGTYAEERACGPPCAYKR